ncbi:hypothetical protein L596_027102 [Steinernema carpocapsae]|uniref:Uncharacterized protein n=1 Tax=Steinernema carpocapsae TaxID=34508 RepID=A0A4U5M489_STECR|nr:hypothetical protein L596_027102 [Steinernema carpocapsae]
MVFAGRFSFGVCERCDEARDVLMGFCSSGKITVGCVSEVHNPICCCAVWYFNSDKHSSSFYDRRYDSNFTHM